MLGHKATLNIFDKTENVSSVFSDNNGMKLEINNNRKTEKVITNAFLLNNTLLNNQCFKEDIKWGLKKYPEANETKPQLT